MILQQLRSIAPPLIVAALVQATVFWWFGWEETTLARASCIWMATAATGLIAARGLCGYAFSHPSIERRLTRRIAIIGSDAHAFRVAERLAGEPLKGIAVLGVFCDAPPPGQTLVRGSISDLISLSREENLNGIIIALPPDATH